MGKSAAVKAQIVDEFDLQQDELLKEQVKELGGVKSDKAVENWMKEGLPFQKLRRRGKDGQVRIQSVFMRDEVEKFLADKAEQPQQSGAMVVGGQRVDPMQLMMAVLDKAMPAKVDRADLFITTEQVLKDYPLSRGTLNRLAKEGVLRRFSHSKKPKGWEYLWSRKQIENL
jgi:hypothetical protein